MSFPAGIEGADATYGHVAVVETVDTAKGTILISEMNVKGPVYSSRTLPIKGGAVYILPKDSISGAGGGSVGTDQCVTGDDSTSDVSGDKASVEAAKKIAKRRLKDYGWETASSTVSTNCGRVNPDGGGTRRTRRPARTASRNRCRAAKWRPRARIGRRTRHADQMGIGVHPATLPVAVRRVGPFRNDRLVLTGPKREKRRNTWT